MLSHITKSMQVFNSEAINLQLDGMAVEEKIYCCSHFDVLWMKDTVVVTTTFDPTSPDRHLYPNKQKVCHQTWDFTS